MTGDAGCEYGGGVTCHGGKGGPKQAFLGWMLYDRTWFGKDKYAITLGGGKMTNPGRYLTLLPPINGADAVSGSPYFTANPGDKAHMWDTTATFHWMPKQYITWWLEAGYRHSDVPYFSGRGGITPPGGNTGRARRNMSARGGGSAGTSDLPTAYANCGGRSVWFPDLRQRPGHYQCRRNGQVLTNRFLRIGVSYDEQCPESRFSFRSRPIAAALRWLRKGAGGYAGRRRRPRQRWSPVSTSAVFSVEHPEQFPVATATAQAAAPELVVTGTVNPDISRNVPVISLASGRVVAIHARLGDTVKKGQLLLTVRSDDISGAFANYRKAVADEILARTQLERAKDLYGHGAIALNDLQVAQDTEDKAKVDVETMAEHLRLLGNDPDHPNGMVDIFAPVSGVITDQQVTNVGRRAEPEYESFHDLRPVQRLDRLRRV